jgi:hypothetical protein
MTSDKSHVLSGLIAKRAELAGGSKRRNPSCGGW